jgi:coenzyme F420-reducing hydrogenase alpha subunit
MTETDIANLVFELPPLKSYKNVGSEVYAITIPGKKGNLSILLNTGELVRSHGIVNSVHEYKLVLKDYLKNGCTFLGVGIIHEFRYD